MTPAAGEVGQEQGLADQAAAKVQDVAAVAQEKASELREHGSARFRDQLDQRSRDAGSQVRSLAEALRRSSTDLSNDGSTQTAHLTGQAADGIERLGTYIEQKSGDELMRDIERFARKRPWMLAGFGTLAGVAAARFIKASSEQRYGGYRRATEQQSLAGRGATYWSDESVGGEYRHSAGVVGSDIPSAWSDDPVPRDPYVGTR